MKYKEGLEKLKKHPNKDYWVYQIKTGTIIYYLMDLCKYCGKKYFAEKKVLKRGKGLFCDNICSNNHKAKETFKKFEKIYKTIKYDNGFDGSEYKLLTTIDEYENSKTKLKFSHKKCGRDDIMISLNHFTKGRGCKDCGYLRVSKKNRVFFKKYTDEQLKEFKIYRSRCYYIADRVYRNNKETLNPNDLSIGRNNGNQVDHIVSIRLCYDYKIDPEIVSSIINLRMLSAYDNNSKGSKLTKEGKKLLLKLIQMDIEMHLKEAA